MFADTGYWIALFDKKDTLHQKATAVSSALGPHRMVTSEMVLVEFLATYSATKLRTAAAGLVLSVQRDANCEVVHQTADQFAKAFELFATRGDKEWSLTDCASFNLMKERDMTDALAHDTHFKQAGFSALLR